MPTSPRHLQARPRVVTVLALLLCSIVAPPSKAALTPEQRVALPPAVNRPVDFVRDIQPIFEASCVQCHGRGKAKGSFSLETREDFLLGGDRGAPAIAGESAMSPVVEMISGLTPDMLMPKKGKRLTPAEISLFRAWIDQGLPWPESVTFFKHEPANLRPRDVALPKGGRGLENPLDRLVDPYFTSHQVPWRTPVDDLTYARRVWFDAIGLPPPPDELRAFLADRSADKRSRLVTRLLANDQAYAEHWLTFWNDLLRNDYKGTGYIDGGRKQITGWLYSALARNLPYDRFVAELISPNAEAEGFTKGILWRGAVNASMVPAMQASQGIAQVFLGVNLKCASCHDSFINEYTLADAYGLASVYADGPLEIAECDKPTGEYAKVKFLYAELGGIDPQAGPEARKAQLVNLITGRANGRLPRTIVNRLWQRFLGYGLVEPVDEMDKPAWSPEVLDWLAEDLVAHRYDLKHLIARILTSRAYQLPSVNVGETEENYVFRGPAVRRLSAEQFSDAVRVLTRARYAKADTRFNRQSALVAGSTPPREPRWIWSSAMAQRAAKPGVVVFRKTVNLPAAPTDAGIALAADDNYTLRINGSHLGASSRRAGASTDFHDLTPHLCEGENTIEIIAENLAPDENRGVAIAADAMDTPAGLIAYARIRIGSAVHDLVSDASWSCTVAKENTSAPPVELGGVELAPWRLGEHFLALAGSPPDTLPVARAALVAADPLMVALGRPNREQVVTVRQATATTLQALEMTNGGTLAALLRQGAQHLLSPNASPTPEATASVAARGKALIEGLYLQSLGRPPTRPERTLAQEILGRGPGLRAEGVEDLLWSLVMLPEFQLLR